MGEYKYFSVSGRRMAATARAPEKRRLLRVSVNDAPIGWSLAVGLPP